MLLLDDAQAGKHAAALAQLCDTLHEAAEEGALPATVSYRRRNASVSVTEGITEQIGVVANAVECLVDLTEVETAVDVSEGTTGAAVCAALADEYGVPVHAVEVTRRRSASPDGGDARFGRVLNLRSGVAVRISRSEFDFEFSFLASPLAQRDTAVPCGRARVCAGWGDRGV